MRLDELANSQQTVPFGGIAADASLTRDIQAELGRLGLLDGPPDGSFSGVTGWALEAFLLARMPDAKAIDRKVARALASAAPWPLKPGNDFVGRVVRRMQELGFFIARHPDCINIVYVEGVDPDGTRNDNAPNRFNDTRMVFSCDANGVPQAQSWDGTTEPGVRFVNMPTNPGGAARIAFDQYKAWCVGMHPRSGDNQHEALVQVAEINVFRDLNKDFRRQGDRQERGLFGINQHWGFDFPIDDIRNASAGCLVGRTKAGHRDFMKRVMADARFRANSGYRFHTAVLDGAELPA
jgi:hypothetical protein